MRLTSWFRSEPVSHRTQAKTKLALETLEWRETPTIGLGAAFPIGGVNEDAILGVTTDRLGNTYVTGYFQGTNVDFDPGAGTALRSSNGDLDIFVAKFNRVGAFQWVNAIGGADADLGNDLAVDAAGNVAVTGYFGNTDVDFDPGAGSSLLSAVEGRDIFVARYAPDGSLLWAKAAGSGDPFSILDNDEGVDLAVDSAGNVVATGYFQNTVDFDPGAGTFNLTSNGGTDIFLWKLAAENGNLIAASQRGSFGDDAAESIVTDRAGAFYVTGSFTGTITLDPDNNSYTFADNGAGDVYLMKVGGDLKTIWGDAFGGVQNDLAFDVAIDSIGNPLVCGRFAGQVDFDSGPGMTLRTSNGSNDAFVASYTSSGQFRIVIAFGGANDDEAVGLTALSGRSFAVGGRYRSTVDFDPSVGVTTRTSAGGGDGYVAAFSLDGGFVWVKSVGGTQEESVHDVAAGPSGSTIAVGQFDSVPSDFDPNAGSLNLTTNGDADGFVLKLADRPDLVSRTALGRWGVAVNNGASFGAITFAGAWNAKLVWKDTMTGDFNGDGRLDVLSRNNLGDWWLGAMNAQGRFVNRFWGRSDPKVVLKFISSGDFTGDGLPDVCGFDANGYWHILVNTGTGFRDELWGMWEEPTTWVYATSGDFDDDGLADLAGRNKLGEWWVSLNTGDAGFDHTLWGQWTESVGWLDVAAGHFNADGRLDVVGRNKTGAWFVGLSQSNNTFAFSTWGSWAAIQSTIKAVFYGDFNGDGFLDVIGRAANGQLHRSTGTGAVFNAQNMIGFMGNFTWIETLAGDYDGDGRDDLAGRTSLGAWFVARTPAGVFTSSQWTAWLATAGWRDTRRGGWLS